MRLKFLAQSLLFLVFRAGNLVGQNLATELASEVTSSSGPVQLADLQRILSSITPQGIIFSAFYFMESLCAPSVLLTYMSWLIYEFAYVVCVVDVAGEDQDGGNAACLWQLIVFR